MGSGVYEGRTLERWQYELTSGGRVFYLVADPTMAEADDRNAKAAGRNHGGGW